MTWKSYATQLFVYLKLRSMRAITFRAEIVTWILLDFLPFFVLFLVWNSIYSGPNPPTTISMGSVIFYYLVAFFIQSLTSVHFEGWRSEEIRHGKIDFFMIKPFSYLQELTLADLGSKLIYTVIFLPLFFLLATLTLTQFSLILPELHLTATSIFSSIALLALSYIVQLSLGICITLGTLWIEGSSGLEHFKTLVLTLFTGALMPLTLMPDWLAEITLHSPLRFLYYIPIIVLTEGYVLTIQEWTELIGLATFFLILTNWIWKRGVYHYSSSGGG